MLGITPSNYEKVNMAEMTEDWLKQELKDAANIARRNREHARALGEALALCGAELSVGAWSLLESECDRARSTADRWTPCAQAIERELARRAADSAEAEANRAHLLMSTRDMLRKEGHILGAKMLQSVLEGHKPTSADDDAAACEAYELSKDTDW